MTRPGTDTIDWLDTGGIGGRGVRGGVLLAGGSWFRFVLQLGANIALARLLGPAEYGLAAVLIVFGAASELLRDSGAATLVTQDRTLAHGQATALFWRSALVGGAAALVVALLGLPLGVVFHEPRFVLFAPLMAPMFLATGIAAIPGAINARNLRFTPGALSDAIGAVAGVVVGIGTALLGGGALALVLQSVVFVVVQSVVVVASCPWRPGRPRRGTLATAHTAESANLTTVQVLNYLVSNVDNVLIGLAAGIRQAGLYNQAYRLLVLPLQQLLGPMQRVVLPTMSLLRGDPDRYRRLYFRLVLGSTLALWSVFAIAATEAHLLVLLIFGAPWLESAAVFQILAISGMAQAVGYVSTWMFIASRRPTRLVRWMIASRLVVVGALLSGLPWGAIGVAVAYSAACVAEVLPEFLLAAQGSGIRIVHLLSAVLWPGVALAGVVLAAWLIHGVVSGTTWFDLAAHVAAELVPVAIVALAVPRVRAVVVEALGLALRRVRPLGTREVVA